MIKRLSAILLIMLTFSFQEIVFACDENLSNQYITQIIYGDYATTQDEEDDLKILLDALYLCSEQTEGKGQDKIDFLKRQKVFNVPKLEKIDIKEQDLIRCSHRSWEYVYNPVKSQQGRRKKLLQNAVNKIYDFGFLNNIIGSIIGGSKGKCNSFSALIYYSHILSDYLADDIEDSDTTVNGRKVPSYSGSSYMTLSGNKPSFSDADMKRTNSAIIYSPLDSYGRPGTVFGFLGPDLKRPSAERPSISFNPPGWDINNPEYGGLTPGGHLFDRCHLIAYALGGDNTRTNVITGTYYLNHDNGMKPLEEKIGKYIDTTNGHVLYRVTPVYKGKNLIASGLQIEAYSVEDKGKEICCNRYYYNIQPGVDIDYSNGDSKELDSTYGNDDYLPFALYEANNTRPDLMYEINTHLEILFEDQKNNPLYRNMMDNLNATANEARSETGKDEKEYKHFLDVKKYAYKYYQYLNIYVPELLAEEEFFTDK